MKTVMNIKKIDTIREKVDFFLHHNYENIIKAVAKDEVTIYINDDVEFFFYTKSDSSEAKELVRVLTLDNTDNFQYDLLVEKIVEILTDTLVSPHTDKKGEWIKFADYMPKVGDIIIIRSYRSDGEYECLCGKFLGLHSDPFDSVMVKAYVDVGLIEPNLKNIEWWVLTDEFEFMQF